MSYKAKKRKVYNNIFNVYLAVGNAVGLLAESHALGAVLGFAGFIRAPDFAVRLFAFNIANGIFRLLA